MQRDVSCVLLQVQKDRERVVAYDPNRDKLCFYEGWWGVVRAVQQIWQYLDGTDGWLTWLYMTYIWFILMEPITNAETISILPVGGCKGEWGLFTNVTVCIRYVKYDEQLSSPHLFKQKLDGGPGIRWILMEFHHGLPHTQVWKNGDHLVKEKPVSNVQKRFCWLGMNKDV